MTSFSRSELLDEIGKHVAIALDVVARHHSERFITSHVPPLQRLG